MVFVQESVQEQVNRLFLLNKKCCRLATMSKIIPFQMILSVNAAVGMRSVEDKLVN